MMLTFFPLHLSSSSSYHPLSYRPVSVPSSKPQSRLWQPRWTWPTLKSNPDWISDRDQSAIHIAGSLKSVWLWSGKETTDYVFDFFSSEWVPHFGRAPPHSCICITYARLPDFPILPTSQTWSSHAGWQDISAQMQSLLSLICWVGLSYHPLPCNQDQATNIQGVQAQYASRLTSLNPSPHYLLFTMMDISVSRDEHSF